MKRIGKAIEAAIAVLVAIMAVAWLALAFAAPLAGLKFCIWYLLA